MEVSTGRRSLAGKAGDAEHEVLARSDCDDAASDCGGPLQRRSGSASVQRSKEVGITVQECRLLSPAQGTGVRRVEGLKPDEAKQMQMRHLEKKNVRRRRLVDWWRSCREKSRS